MPGNLFGEDVRFLLICGCNFIVGTPYSMPVAFLPIVAFGLGLDESEIGQILSSYAVGLFFTSAWAGQYMQNYEKKKLLNFALLLLVAGLAVFSVVVTLKNAFLFQLFGLLARLIQGISVGLASCILFSLIPKFYPESIQKKIALMELGSGLAVGLGPLIGSLFYAIAGFAASFLAIGIIILIFQLFIIRKNVCEDSGKGEALLNKGEIAEVSGKEGISYKSLSRSCRMILTYLMLTISVTTVSVYAPVFSIFVLEKYGISPEGTSVLLAISPFAYSLPAFFTDYVLSPNYDRRIYIILGLLCQSLAVILIAGSFFFGQSLIFLVIGLCFHGFGTFLAVIPGMPEIMDVIKEIHPDENPEAIHDFSSGLFNSVWGLGELLGPLIGGYLVYEFKFKKAMEIYAFIIWIGLCAYIILGRGYEALLTTSIQPSSTEEEKHNVREVEMN